MVSYRIVLYYVMTGKYCVRLGIIKALFSVQISTLVVPQTAVIQALNAVPEGDSRFNSRETS